MQTTSLLYKQIFSDAQDRLNVEYRMTVNNSSVYGQKMLIDGTITETLFSVLSMGNLISKTLEISYYKGSSVVIPRGAEIAIECRIKDGSRISEWIPKGTFFTDTRKTNRGVTTLSCYDSMLKANTPFMKSGTWTSMTTLAMYQSICSLMGVSQDSATVSILTNKSYAISKAPSIGEHGTSMARLLEWIGPLYGYNWIITENNALKMIPLFPSDYTTYKADANIDFSDSAVTVDRVQIYTSLDKTDYLRYPNVTQTQWDAMTGFVLEGTSLYMTRTILNSLAPTLIGKTYRGFDAETVSEDPAVQIGDGVTLEENQLTLVKRVTDIKTGFASMSAPYEEEVISEYPMTESIQGLVRNVKANGASLTVVDEKIEAEVVNRRNADVKAVKVQYYLSDSDFVPAHGSWQDTIPEVTDGKYLWSRMYITYNDDTFSTTEPSLAEDAVYQEILSQSARITVNADNITSEVERAVVAEAQNVESIQGEINKRAQDVSEIKTNYSRMQQTVNEVVVELGEKVTRADAQADAQSRVDAYDNTVKQYLRFSSSGLELGENTSQFKALLTNTRLSFTGKNGNEVAWISNNDLNIKYAVIDTANGGTLSLSPFTMRVTSGQHLQIVFTG